MLSILLFILVLGLLIFVHELGHFLAARRSGVAVEEFGFGFPPRMVGIRRGPTIYSLNWIPFGGFVRMQGEQEDVTARPDSFVAATWWKKIIILLAGVTMNVLLAIVLLSVCFGVGIVADPELAPKDGLAITSPVKTIAIVSDGLPAAVSGLRTGQEIVSINGKNYTSSEQLIEDVQAQKYPPLSVIVRSDTGEETLTITATTVENTQRYGLGLQAQTIVRYPWWIAPWYGVKATGQAISQTFAGFGQLVAGLTKGQVSQDLTGPIGIAVLTDQVRQLGAVSVLQFMALLSVSLAVLNILPLPALDGGRAMFVIITKLTGRTIQQRTEAIIHAVGFYALIALVFFITIQDVQRFSLLQNISRFFQN